MSEFKIELTNKLTGAKIKSPILFSDLVSLGEVDELVKACHGDDFEWKIIKNEPEKQPLIVIMNYDFILSSSDEDYSVYGIGEDGKTVSSAAIKKVNDNHTVEDSSGVVYLLINYVPSLMYLKLKQFLPKQYDILIEKGLILPKIHYYGKY